MSFLSQITTGAARTGIRVVIAAQEKMGKTTFGAYAPAALLLPLEVGFAGVQVAKTPMLQSFENLMDALHEIVPTAQQGRFPYRSLILDSGTALERYIHDYVLRLDPGYASASANARKAITMESAHGGYGKAYSMANSIFGTVLQTLDMLAVHAGINIIFTCHVFSSKVSDPTVGEYDSWDLLLHSPKNQKTYGKREMITQWADVIGFIYEPVFLMTTDKSSMTRGVSANKGRVLALSRTPAYTAGNRFGIIGEVPLPPPPVNSWNQFADALYKRTGIDAFTR